jgi:alpha-1,2-mannosyltransferase
MNPGARMNPGVRMKRSFIVAGSAAAIAVAIALLPGHRGWFDIGVYHDAMTYWVRRHGDLYAFVRPASTYGYTYPPFAAICMSPMAFLGWYPTIAINLAITVAASAFVLYLLVDPIARKRGWPRWYAFALAACLFAMLAPVRDTFSFGQVNLLLLALVYVDLALLERGRPAGFGIGLAAAIKLTPAVFIVYLLLSGERKAARNATLTAAGATLLAAALAPDATRAYFAEAMWDTGRVGSLAYISNQSLLGAVARLRPESPDRLLWIVLVLAVVALWIFRVRAAARDGDKRAGFALTGVVACLISPVTWVHHLVWLIPALVVLVDAGRRTAAAIAYLLLCTSLVWLWPDARGVLGVVGGNCYVFIALALLAARPAAPRAPLAGRPPLADPADAPVFVGSTATR